MPSIDEIDLNLPFSEQPSLKSFLESSSQGPVSEVLLYRLLAVAERVIKQEADRAGSRLIGLQLGYQFWHTSEPTPDDDVEVYALDWGENLFSFTTSQPVLTSRRSGSVSLELIESLIDRFNEEILRQTPEITAENKAISVFLSAVIAEARSSHPEFNNSSESGIGSTLVLTIASCDSCESKTRNGETNCYKKGTWIICRNPCPSSGC